MHHRNYNTAIYTRTFLTDLKRDQHSQSNGYLTKRISNDMINKHLEEIADSLKVVVKNRVDELKS